MTRACSLLVAPVLYLAMTTTLLAGSNPLEVIPDDAYGFAVIQDLADANERVAKLTQKMQLPVPDLLSMVKLMAGINQGIDESGGLAIAMLPVEGEPFGILGFVPLTDYQKFIGSLSPSDADAAITEVTIFGQTMLAGKKGNFAVLAMDPDQKDVLEKVLAGETSVTKTVEPLKEWMDQHQLSVVVTPAGKTKLFRSIADALPTKEQLESGLKSDDDDEDCDADKEDADEEGDDEDADDDDSDAVVEANALASVGQMFGGFKELLIAADEQLTHLAAGVRIEDNATLHVAVRALFVKDGKLAAWAKNIKVPSEGLLFGVPKGKYVFAYGGISAQFSPEVWTLINQFSDTGMKMMGLDEESRKKYAELTEKLQEGKLYTSGVMGMMRPGDSIYSTAISVEHVKNADEHMKLTGEAYGLMASALRNPKTQEPMYELNRVKVAEMDALELVANVADVAKLGAGDAPGAEQARGFFDMMFGKDGRVTMYVAKAGDHAVVSAYSREQLVRGVEHVQAGGEGLEVDGDIAKTTAMLPAGSQWVAYANPEGLVQLIGSFVKAFAGDAFQLPAFPPSEPIGVAARVNETALDAEIVLPDNVVAGIGQFIFAMGQMFQGGGAPLP